MENSPHKGSQGLWPMAWPQVGGGGSLEKRCNDNEMFERIPGEMSPLSRICTFTFSAGFMIDLGPRGSFLSSREPHQDVRLGRSELCHGGRNESRPVAMKAFWFL